ncbi:MAG: bifunctional metallophosphatase/5'-nucleotidase [Muribaculaceae bacterium]|nr:bifunctional metallophosphatase/5'-nucleotidase [Muribaculaceae bacterium]
MKIRNLIFSASAILLSAGAISFASAKEKSNELVILHTNDTHSLIDPDEKGEGGVLQRKFLIDSIRKAEKNVLLVDAGDCVQGTLYFKFFKGEVEFPLMDMMGYDIQILGNHEFDNGLDDLAKYYKKLKADRLSANYDFSGTPMAGIMKPYSIKKVGDKKIAFIGINIDPGSLISNHNYVGMKFSDPIATANDLAARLKKEEKADLVVAVTHIGAKKENDKPTDYELAAASRDIDIIIGGHSHTVILPENQTSGYPSLVKNADGRPVLVTQTGRYGKNLGYIKIDLEDQDEDDAAEDFEYRLIPVTDRFPKDALDQKMDKFISPYREFIDKINHHIIGRSEAEMDANARTGRYVNWSADFAKWYGDLKADSLRSAGMDIPAIDMAMMNVGGIRHSMPRGDVSEGLMLSTFPFSNRMVIVKIKGKDFADAMAIAARKGGESISDEVRVLTDGKGNVESILISGQPLDPEKDYYLSTSDYLAWGNDDFVPLANGEIIWSDVPEMCAPLLRYLKVLSDAGLPIDGDPRARFIPIVKL